MTNNAFCQTGVLAALADSGQPDPDKLQKALEQTAAQFESAALEVRKLCEKHSPGTGGYGNRPVLPSMEAAGSVEVLGVNFFTLAPEELESPASMFLPTITRSKGSNPWGSTRVAAIAHLGDSFYAMHYVCPGIGKLALMDELSAFSNQTARFRNVGRAFIFAGDSYRSVLTELERPSDQEDAKLLDYGGVYRCLQLPVHLLSCDSTGAVQLQIMAVPGYRTKLAKAALKAQYRSPTPDVPEWDAVFQGVPFVLAADMDLRRVDAAIRAARARGHRQIAMAALSGQAEQVLFPRYRDTGSARVFVLTADAIEAVTGRKPVPYTPPRTQFMTSKGDVVDAPPIQTHRKTGKPAGA